MSAPTFAKLPSIQNEKESNEQALLIFNELYYGKYKNYYQSLSRKMVGEAWWEDVVQNVGIKAWMRGVTDIRTLPVWLKIMIKNESINMKRNRAHQIYSMDDFIEDELKTSKLTKLSFQPLKHLESYLFVNKYHFRLSKELKNVFRDLSNKEQLILFLHFKKESRLGEIAKLFGIHPSSVTRNIERICSKICKEIKKKLKDNYKMSLEEVEECCLDFVNNKNYIVTALDQIKDII